MLMFLSPGRYLLGGLARILLALLLIIGLSAGADGARKASADGEAGARYIVQLVPPDELVDTVGMATSSSDAIAASVTERAMALPGVRVQSRLQRMYHGLVVEVDSSDPQVLRQLRSLPGVLAVHPDTLFYPTLYDAVQVTGVDRAWDAVGGSENAGSDVRIAVIDSGIDISHPMLVALTWSYPKGYPVGLVAYTSPKVIAARAYFRPEDPPKSGEGTPVPGPLGSSHGTHLAAVAAGMGVEETLNGATRLLSGVAPGARLMNYRVFYPSSSDGYERAYAVEIIQAIEDAVADGADILVVGWSDGGAQLPFASPVAAALRAAIASGVVVVGPAGNEGPGAGSASRLPGGVEEVITVGAQGAAYGRALFGAPIDADTSTYPLIDVAAVSSGGDPYACSPLPAGSLSGAAVLIRRGECPFADKVYNAEQAGALLALIVNSADTVTDMACGGDYCGEGVIGIQAALLASTAGQQLLDWANTPGASATIALSGSGRVLSSSPELVAPFSGRGPAFGMYLKPDLTAPGVAVVAAAHTANPSGTGYVALSGTSVAAAHVAGGAAILLAEHPGWQQAQIKGAMVGNARIGSTDGVSELAVTRNAFDYGAGLLDVPGALATALAVSPASISLGVMYGGSSRDVVLAVQDVRPGGTFVDWSISWAPSDEITVSGPATITIKSGNTHDLALTFAVSPSAEGAFGTVITLSSPLGSVRVPVWGMVPSPPAAASLLVIDNDLEFSGGGVDTLPYIEAGLQALGIDYAVWNADAYAGAEQTLPSAQTLSSYRAILWTLGEKANPDGTFAIATPPTALDQQALMSYLDGGGRLLVMGQNVAAATDNNPDPDPLFGRSTLYRAYLGSHYLQDNVFTPNDAPDETVAVTGLVGTLLQGMLLDLGGLGTGAGNQASIDELAAGGTPEGDALVRPIAAATGSSMVEAGYVALIKSDEPTLESPVPGVQYRVLHQSFGLEGVNDRPGMTSALQLLDRELDWLLDELSVAVPCPLVGGPNTLTRLSVNAISSVGSPGVAYRWRIGEGASARLVTSTQPEVYVPFAEIGDYPLSVEVTDSLGHKAIGEGVIRIVPGGASHLTVSATTAEGGDVLTYSLNVDNVGGSVPVASAAFMFPLPAGTSYVAHSGDGVTFDGSALHWSGSLASGSNLIATLDALVQDSGPSGTVVEAPVEFTMDGLIFTRTVVTTVSPPPAPVWLLYLPLVQR